ncbi:hypothetical protein AAER29_20055, partial [Pseudomonas aeruginosa]
RKKNYLVHAEILVIVNGGSDSKHTLFLENEKLRLAAVHKGPIAVYRNCSLYTKLYNLPVRNAKLKIK